MSGTSADGVDVALVRIDPDGFADGQPFISLEGHRNFPYPEKLRQMVLDAAGDRLLPSGICILQRLLGEHNGNSAKSLADSLGVVPDLASLHGQTVQHRPEHSATLQLADPYVLSEKVGCPVVWDLRRRDMALGGQGAPLVPRPELWLRGQRHSWAALNLGGIANVTIWNGTALSAWDTGPAMSLLDLAARRWLDLPFDPHGMHATGVVREALLERWLGHPYFATPPPKSTGREVFGEAWLTSEIASMEAIPLADRLSTLAAFTAESIAMELRQWIPCLPAGMPLQVSGGGANHARLRQELSRRLPELRLEDDIVFPSGAREAVLWALLGAACAAGVPGNEPAVTGASREAILGSWTWP